MGPKVWCSSIRCDTFRSRLASNLKSLVAKNPSPREGDIVLVRVAASCGAYTIVENQFGREVNLYEGNSFVGVLGTRESGTNLTAKLPSGLVKRGQILSLVAVGGLIGEAVCVPKYFSAGALPVEVIGFFPGFHGRVANLQEGQKITSLALDSNKPAKPVIFVAGISAEAGKTTFVCRAIQALSKLRPGVRIPAPALGHFRHQEHRLETDGHRLQLAEAPPLAADFPALALRTNQLLRLDQQEKTNTAVLVFCAPILVPFPDAKRMIKKTLTHASYYQAPIQIPTFRKNRFHVNDGGLKVQRVMITNGAT